MPTKAVTQADLERACALAADSLAAYCQLLWPQYKLGRHLTEITRTLEAVERGDASQGDPDRVILLCPPRHSKSMTTSQFFPSWFLGRNPDKKVIIGACSQSLSEDFGIAVRNNMQDPLHRMTFPRCRLSTDSQAKEKFTTTRGGQFFAVGRGSTTVGRGAHLFIVDDPIRDQEEAQSEELRRKLKSWFTSVAYTRLMPQGRIVICQCLAEGSRVLLADGRSVPIETIEPGNEVWGYDERLGPVPRRVTHAMCSGEDATFTVSTSRADITANERHPFLVLVKDRPGAVPWKTEWRRLRELQVGDLLVTQKGLPEEHASVTILPGTDRPVTEHFMWLLGYLYGDGFVTRHERKNQRRKDGSPVISWAVSCALKSDSERNEKIARLFESELGRRPYEPAGVRVWRLDSNEAGRFLWSLGLKSGAKKKRIGDWVLGTSATMKRAFLRGLLDADGSKLRGCNDSYRLVLAGYDLLEGARQLAFQCGVRATAVKARRATIQPPNSSAPVDSVAYSTTITFDEESAEGRSALSEDMPHHRLIRLDRIRAIVPAGRRRVYDLTVEGENFIAENIYVHNTLWHEDDLAGWLMRESEDNWRVLRFPAIAEEDEAWRKKGEALWPEQYPLKTLERIRDKSGMTTSEWMSLYQQRAVGDDGAVFKLKWFRDAQIERELIPQQSHHLTKYILVDPANSKRKGSDYTSMWVVGLGTDKNVYVLDGLRDKLGLRERANELFRLHRTWKPVSHVFYEEYGLQADIQYVRERQHGVHGEPVYTFNIKPVGGRVRKEDRIRRLEPWFRDGRIKMPRFMPRISNEGKQYDLTRLFEEEYKSFPVGAHDDMFDCLARIADPEVQLNWPQTQEEVFAQNAHMGRMLGDRTSWMSA